MLKKIRQNTETNTTPQTLVIISWCVCTAWALFKWRHSFVIELSQINAAFMNL